MRRKRYTSQGEVWDDLGPGRSLALKAIWYRRLMELTTLQPVVLEVVKPKPPQQVRKDGQEHRFICRICNGEFVRTKVRTTPFYCSAQCTRVGAAADARRRYAIRNGKPWKETA